MFHRSRGTKNSGSQNDGKYLSQYIYFKWIHKPRGTRVMIHPTAIVDKNAEIYPDVEIGPYCTIGAHVKIGKGTKLKSHVVVEGWTEIGEGNIIFPFAVLGAVPQDLKYKGEPT